MTSTRIRFCHIRMEFQYRKRYEVTCDMRRMTNPIAARLMFQYRKRYEVTCDTLGGKSVRPRGGRFQYRKRYEVTCDMGHKDGIRALIRVSIPQAV